MEKMLAWRSDSGSSTQPPSNYELLTSHIKHTARCLCNTVFFYGQNNIIGFQPKGAKEGTNWTQDIVFGSLSLMTAKRNFCLSNGLLTANCPALFETGLTGASLKRAQKP
jgi:hypothetical protein